MEEPDRPITAGVSPHRPAVLRSGPAPTTSASGQGANAMAMLADSVEVARRRRHPQAHPPPRSWPQPPGQTLANLTVPATPDGYRQLLEMADRHHGQRVWAIEAPAATAPASPASCTLTPSRWWSWIGPSGPPAAMAPSPIRSPQSGPPARCWAASSWPSTERPVHGPRCRCGGRPPLGGPGCRRGRSSPLTLVGVRIRHPVCRVGVDDA
jgi:hypothetical protein